MWLKLSLFGLVLCPDWLREDAGVGDRSKEVVEVCSHHRWETSLGLSYVCAHGWAETLLVIHLLGRLSPEEIWSAEDSDLKMWGADRDMIRSFHSCRSRFNPESVKQKMEGMGCRFLPLGSQEYPSVLADLSEPPAGIFVMGNSEVWSRFLEVPRLTIVGTRGATPYGLRATASVARAACRSGVAIVSGMALGIDGRAHHEALEMRGSTIAVLGGGVDVVSPAGHESLYEEIVRRGVVVSELPPGTRAEGWTFPVRNRILAAFGDALVVTEAPERSGTMITVEEAMRLGRSVFAVPGSVFASSHRGNNLLIHEGANVIMDADWFLQDFRCLTRTLRGSRVMEGGQQDEVGSLPPGSSPVERLVVGGLGRGSRSVDELAAATGLTVRETAAVLSTLELLGKVVRTGAGKYALIC